MRKFLKIYWDNLESITDDGYQIQAHDVFLKHVLYKCILYAMLSWAHMGIKVDQKIGLNSSKQYYMIYELPEHLYIQLEDIFLFRGPSVRSKNTLITGRVGGAGVSQPTCKTRTSFPIPLALTSLKKTHNPT